MLNSTALYTGRRSATVAPAPAPAPSAAARPASHLSHAVEISQAPRAWRSAAEVSASHRSEVSRSESEGAAQEPAPEGRRCLSHRTCAWAACGSILGGFFGGAIGVVAVELARETGEQSALEPGQMGALGATAGAVLGSATACLIRAYCVDPAED